MNEKPRVDGYFKRNNRARWICPVVNCRQAFGVWTNEYSGGEASGIWMHALEYKIEFHECFRHGVDPVAGKQSLGLQVWRG